MAGPPFPSRPAETRGTLLSHHAIMELVAPFSARGYRMDMAASDRGRGRMVFHAVEVSTADDRGLVLRSVMRLERPHRLKLRVVRSLESTAGPTATMIAEGDDVEALLTAVEAVDPERQFHFTPAGLVTRSYRSESWRSASHARFRRRPVGPRLVRAEARLEPVTLTGQDTEGGTFELRLEASEARALDVPWDFLAVLGWRWRPLRWLSASARAGSVWLSGGPATRTHRLETLVDHAVAHVAATLSAPPADFHARHRRARWRAALQRLAPWVYLVTVTLGFTAAVWLLPKRPAVHMLMQLLSLPAIGGFFLITRVYGLQPPGPPGPLGQRSWVS
ncbi:MAG: hypothetical protein AAFZ18_30750 [Myxococcota bacterium]